MYPSNVDEAIKFHKANISQSSKTINELMKLKNKNHGQIVHVPDSALYDRKMRVISVNCVCGEQVIYRVPLNNISEFVCPKDPNREGKKE